MHEMLTATALPTNTDWRNMGDAECFIEFIDHKTLTNMFMHTTSEHLKHSGGWFIKYR